MMKRLLTAGNQNKCQIIEPLSCLIRLAMLSVKPKGSKISFYRNRIHIYDPNFAQGIMRWIYDDNKNDIHNLKYSIIKAVECYQADTYLTFISRMSIQGLDKLKMAYDEHSIISHSINYYQNIIRKFGGEKITEETLTQSRILAQDELLEAVDRVSKKEHDVLTESLKNVWSKEDIIIVFNLLKLIESNYQKQNYARLNAYYQSLDNIVSMKENIVHQIVEKYSTILSD